MDQRKPTSFEMNYNKSFAVSRRSFLQKAGLTGLALPLAGHQLFSNNTTSLSSPAPFISTNTIRMHKVAVFSKALQWTELNQMADMVAESGIDGLDLTVRPGGHVEPERVKDDLPKIAEAMKKVGKEIVMMTTAIGGADEPYTKDILTTARQLGIGFYRMNWYSYDKLQSIDDNLQAFVKRMAALAEMNKASNIKAGYQNHAGTGFGSPVWDLVQVLRQVNSPWVGSQYDIRHAVVEGANSWPLGFDQVQPFINTIVMKDFYWSKNNGKWSVTNVPLGEGMVDFKAYKDKVATLSPVLPITIHQEYDLGGAEHGNRKANITEAQMLAAMKKDLAFVKNNI
ncbi:sugar phosphate isomerase/epimerase family protein [uncultured Imperialibacter sp.]|uniref:sugar phosphate isomerase/epimerase family protein n=1 Tax=uncultured Imperialibacter sp. TaxID=1672639 RepID=UPI0030DC9AD9